MSYDAHTECLAYASRWERIHNRRAKQQSRNTIGAPAVIRRPSTRWHGPGGKPDALGNWGKRYTGYFNGGYCHETFQARFAFIRAREKQVQQQAKVERISFHKPEHRQAYLDHQEQRQPNAFLRFFGYK